MNKVYKVITSTDTICFIIQTEGDMDFWYWEVSRSSWNSYWEKHKSPACLIGRIMKWAANQFVNDEENSALGCSCGSFLTMEEAIFDYLEIEVITY